jgi:hypothetical protein
MNDGLFHALLQLTMSLINALFTNHSLHCGCQDFTQVIISSFIMTPLLSLSSSRSVTAHSCHVAQSAACPLTTHSELRMAVQGQASGTLGLALVLKATRRFRFLLPPTRTIESRWCNLEAGGSFEKPAHAADRAAVGGFWDSVKTSPCDLLHFLNWFEPVTESFTGLEPSNWNRTRMWNYSHDLLLLGEELYVLKFCLSEN